MARELRLAGVFAHPDDESKGVGGTFASYAAEGSGPGYQSLPGLPEATHRRLWRRQPFYRAYSLVNGGRPSGDRPLRGRQRPVLGATISA